ncbi:MAG: hypothetical protein HY914_08220 [Desulfomonile tiedjei]|nr:hypothetical protein [Desulfomonile tiedjei]
MTTRPDAHFNTPYGGARAAFWIIGIALGLVLAYTSRHFINTDGLTYIEMGEGLRNGDYWKLVNLACSPLYPLLLGVGQIVLNTNPMDELSWLKAVGFISLVLAMGGCDLLLIFVRKELDRTLGATGTRTWFPMIAAMVYAVFLVCSLVWIKVRLVNPDMLVFFFVLASTSALLWIREDPNSYGRFAVLGICLGLGYLTKTYLLVFSPVYLVMAGCLASSVKKAWPRVLVSAAVMLLVSAPLIAALSYRVGRPSIGEVANLAYTTEVAARGNAVNRPQQLHENPKVFLYDYPRFCTDALGFDVAYWSLGVEASFDAATQMKALGKNLWEFLGSSMWLFVPFLLFLGAHWRAGALKAPRLRPPPFWLVLVIPGVCGIGLFALVHLEMRYVAPFVFCLVSGLVMYPSYAEANRDRRAPVSWAAGLTVFLLLAMLAHGALDQTLRGLKSSGRTISFQDAFLEYARVKSFLAQHGVAEGRTVAVVGYPATYWARMARVGIVARIPSETEFLDANPRERAEAVKSLAGAGVAALLGTGAGFAALAGEGWQHVPGTRGYFVLFP